MTEEPDDGFDVVMGLVERERGFASASYKQKCLRRRVGVRMRIRGTQSFHDYARLLEGDELELDRLVDSLTINVTHFFRNWPVWESIAREVVPVLWKSQEGEIRVWSAGCASGEEAYSIAMLFHRHAAISGMLAQIDRVNVLGTDVDPNALAAAKEASYRAADLIEVPQEFCSRYFSPTAPVVPVAGIRRMVRFSQHDLLGADYPPEDQHLIICRNVLIYFDRESQERVLRRFGGMVAPGGFLVLGKVETLLGASRTGFVPVAGRERIFRKVSQ
jgi:chemotaxis methyl-accepting protein methylase